MKQVNQLLDQYGMNYSVNKEPLILASDQGETPFFGLVNSESREAYGVVKGKYVPYQNEELMELALRVEEISGYKLDLAKAYGNGSRVEVRLAKPEKTLEYAQTGDVMKRGFGITNSHDGSGSLRVNLETELLSCSNGMTRWVQGESTAIRHSKNMKAVIEQTLRAFDVIEQEEKSFMQTVHRMIETPLPQNKAATIMNNLMQEIVGIDMRKVSQEWTSDDYSTKALNIGKSLFDSFDEEFEYKGTTLWGALNGVTHFTSHKAGRDNTRSTSKVFGDLMRKDRKAFNMLVEELV